MRTTSFDPRSVGAVKLSQKLPGAVVAIGSSAGGIQALRELLGTLTPDFPAPILVVQHVSRHAPSILHRVLGWRTSLPVRAVEGGEWPEPGTVYVAPSNQHLIVDADGKLCLSASPPVNFCRPSADPLFQTVASVFKEKAIAVVLTGYGRDGSRGVEEVRRNGGMAIAQDESTSEVFEMPCAAIDLGMADLILPLSRIAEALIALVGDTFRYAADESFGPNLRPGSYSL